MTVEELNAAPVTEARAALARCCGARAWVDAMVTARPFANERALFDRGDAIGRELRDADWREAFSHHPRIGDVDTLRRKFAATAAWAAGEQSGAAGAGDDVLSALAKGNEQYEQRFGYIFIVCATGSSAEQMLAALRARLGNDPATEMKIAAGEQMKITRLRLEKLFAEGR